jgi:hypothetical protein
VDVVCLQELWTTWAVNLFATRLPVTEVDLLFTEPVAGIGYLSDHVALLARVER